MENPPGLRRILLRNTLAGPWGTYAIASNIAVGG